MNTPINIVCSLTQDYTIENKRIWWSTFNFLHLSNRNHRLPQYLITMLIYVYWAFRLSLKSNVFVYEGLHEFI
ncbi:hypothetical protein BT93_C0941 [Corymbia citriodora subsp. variegata]|nr:hypothetical protein BT93_C0941 [Corymbia citriodora subsp. variegata]